MARLLFDVAAAEFGDDIVGAGQQDLLTDPVVNGGGGVDDSGGLTAAARAAQVCPLRSAVTWAREGSGGGGISLSCLPACRAGDQRSWLQAGLLAAMPSVGCRA